MTYIPPHERLCDKGVKHLDSLLVMSGKYGYLVFMQEKPTDIMELKGTGLHTAESARLRILPKSRGGSTFEFESLPGIKTVEDLKKAECSARNSTVLTCQGGVLRTPEHFLGVLTAFPHLALRVFLKGGEFPAGDGSGRPYLRALTGLFGEAGLWGKAGFIQYASKVEAAYGCKNGWYKVRPADSFSVRFEISAGPVRQVCVLDSEDPNYLKHYLERIVPSRTFITYGKYRKGVAEGLLKGASKNSGILLAESREDWRRAVASLDISPGVYPFLNVKRLHWGSELAAHKILDLLGDLALNGPGIPKLALDIKNGGHCQNHQLVKDLKDEYA